MNRKRFDLSFKSIIILYRQFEDLLFLLPFLIHSLVNQSPHISLLPTRVCDLNHSIHHHLSLRVCLRAVSNSENTDVSINLIDFILGSNTKLQYITITDAISKNLNQDKHTKLFICNKLFISWCSYKRRITDGFGLIRLERSTFFSLGIK